MVITRLYIDYFGKFTGREFILKPGINIIHGENEAGKSTLHTFIRGMLFGIERLRGRGAATKDDVYTRYLPWDYPGAYGGQMDIRVKDKEYRLKRSFHANDKYFTVTELATGRELKLKEGHISELIPGLTESAYRNTVSIEQLRAETDAELASHVRNYIANLSIAKHREVNVAKAIEYLKEQKKALESVPYARQLGELAAAIEKCEENEKKIDHLTASLKELEEKEKSLKEQLNRPKSPESQREEELIAQLPAIIEKYKLYRDLSRQYSQAAAQADELERSLARLRQHIKEMENRQKAYKEGLKKKGIIYAVAGIAAAVLGAVLMKSAAAGAVILIAAAIAVTALYALSGRKNAEYKEEALKAGMTLENGEKQYDELVGRKKELEDRCDELNDAIMTYMQEFTEEDELTPEAVERLKETAAERKRASESMKAELNEKLRQYSFQIGTISHELKLLENNETELIRNKEQYEYIMRRKRENDIELEAINLAICTIQELAAEIHDSFGLQLNKAVSDIIDTVTNHKYNDLKVDEKLNIKLIWKNRDIVLDRLSAGTIDQVYFALRMAVCDMLLGDEPMPLILDDSFALYDDSRVKAVLTEIAKRRQVLLFTCQTREKEFLDELKIQYNHIKL